MFSDGLDPGYYENPSALTYLLYLVFKVRYTAGFPFGGGFDAGAASAFLTARVVVALIGTLVVGLTYWAGARYADRRAGLVAAAVMAVAFLPVFYSKHALNDVVTLAPVTLALVACLFAYRAGRIEDWLLAGGAIGAATATKYTAGAMLLTVLLAAALRVQQDRAELRRAVIGVVAAGVACFVVFAILNPFVILNPSEARGQINGQSAQADTAKLGQDDTYGWLYYLGTLTWGLGWAPLLAAVAGAVVILRRDWRIGLLLVVFPVCFYLYMGAQGRFFGRWLLPIYPALCVLAGIAAVAAADLLRRHRGWALGGHHRGAVRPGTAGEHPRRRRARARGHPRGGAALGPRERPAGGAARRRAVRPGVVAGRAAAPAVAGPAPVPGLREAAARPPDRALPAQGLLLGDRRLDPEAARAEGGAPQLAQLLPGARRGERGDRALLAVRARIGRGRILLRQLLQLPPARLRAAGPGRRDPSAARLHAGGRVIRRRCP